MLLEFSIKPLDERIANAMGQIVRESKYPRAVKSKDLIGLGIVTEHDQSEFCKALITDPENKYGRVLVISRQTNSEHPEEEEKLSPVHWYSRGSENELGESFIVPHMEPKGNKAEILKLKEGRAILILHDNESDVNSCKFINMKVGKSYTIRTGQIHSILCVSPIVHLFELKVVGSNEKNNPKFALEMGLVNEKNEEQSGPQVDEYLRTMHTRANAVLGIK